VSNRRLLEIIGILLLVLMVVLGYRLAPMLAPVSDVTVNPENGCDLQRQSCLARLPNGGSVVLSLMPQPVPLARPFKVEAQISDSAAEAMEIDFSGIDMNMGYNRNVLVDQGKGRFLAEATLPVCVTGRMNWLATLVITTKGQRIAVPFKFVTGD
jgi:hypothetical protein